MSLPIDEMLYKVSQETKRILNCCEEEMPENAQ